MILFMLGIFSIALLTSAVSVYVFHDVGKDEIGHWNQAFSGLCIESAIFAFLIAAGVALITFLGRQILRLKGYSPNLKLGFFLGVGVAVLQYPWDLVARTAFPCLADSSRILYLIAAIVLCATVLVRDNFRQMQLAPG